MLKKRKLLSTNLKLKCIQTREAQERLAPLGIMESPESICSPRQYGAEGIKGSHDPVPPERKQTCDIVALFGLHFKLSKLRIVFQ